MLKTKNSYDYDEKYMKTKFDLDEELELLFLKIIKIIHKFSQINACINYNKINAYCFLTKCKAKQKNWKSLY